MPVAGTASFIFGLIALAAVVYIYFLLQKLQREVQAAKEDMQAIASHIEEEVHPVIEQLRLPPTAQLITTEEDIAKAMLCSMFGTGSGGGGLMSPNSPTVMTCEFAEEVDSVDLEEEEGGQEIEELDTEDDEEDATPKM